MGKKKAPWRFIAVARGKIPGIYEGWDEAQPQVNGFPGNKYQGFNSRAEAEAYVGANAAQQSLGSQPAAAASSSANAHDENASSSRGEATDGQGIGASGRNDKRGLGFDAAGADDTDCSKLGEDQQRAFDMAIGGGNVFLTGGPGCGKSYVLERIISELRKRHGKDSVLVLAPTGVAALNVGGQTMHAKNPGPGKVEGTSKCFGNMWATKKQWRKVRTLIIDEISMADAEFLDYYIAQAHTICADRGGSSPSIQLIFCGDFFQLPPVAKSKRSLHQPSADVGSRCSTFFEQCESEQQGRQDVPLNFEECAGRFAFQTACWREANFTAVWLTKCYRIEDTEDTILLDGLRDIRGDKRSSEAVERLIQSTKRPLPMDDKIEPTRIYTTNAQVDAENEQKLRCCDKHTRQTYIAEHRVEPVAEWTREPLMKQLEYFGSDCPARESLELRINAQVMLLKNEPLKVGSSPESRLVNGSRGIVIGFEEAPADREEKSGRSKRFGGGKAARQAAGGDPTLYPRVRFDNGREKLVMCEDFEKEIFLKGKCIRSQVPLALAWAITVHKSQGSTLTKLVVDLSNSFEAGMAYVAISRAKSVEGLQILHYSPDAIKTSRLVTAFYDALAAGGLDDFVRSQPPWWTAIVEHPETRWRQLFERNPHFAGWVARHSSSAEPPAAASSSSPSVQNASDAAPQLPSPEQMAVALRRELELQTGSIAQVAREASEELGLNWADGVHFLEQLQICYRVMFV